MENNGTTNANAVELIFLGTGTSSSLPHIECLTALPGDKPCHTCLSTLTPEGRKNIRRNTSVAIRMDADNGEKVTIVIDVGKNFQAAALEWFPKYGLRRIDALLITHAHADAMNGLDDLRGWTLNHKIQSHIDVYLSQATFQEVQRSFPYLVAREFASGGGDVPEFKWHIISDKVPFEIQDTGIHVTPFSVHHGRLFLTSPVPAYIPTPTATMPSMPTSTVAPLPLRQQLDNWSKAGEKFYPYPCFGFKIHDQIVYLSDVSYIPDDVWPIFETNGTSRLPVCVLDCLKLHRHTSHMGLADSVATTRRIGASRTYLTGFGHEVAHDEYVTIGEVLGGSLKNVVTMTPIEQEGVGMIRDGQRVWLRPAYDGLRVFVSKGGPVIDEGYQ